jgi:hypothetical protein
LIIIITPIAGAIGAAYVWTMINVVYFAFGTLVMFRYLLQDTKKDWFTFDIGLPSLAMVCSAYLLFLCIDIDSTQRFSSFLIIATITILIMLTGLLFSSKLHGMITLIRLKNTAKDRS